MRLGIAPVEGRAIRAEGQTVAHRDVACHAPKLAIGVAIERRQSRVARLVDGAHPQAAQCVSAAIVEALLRRVVGRRTHKLT